MSVVGLLVIKPMSQMGPKPENLNASICFPLCSWERTLRNEVGMSVLCQQETHAPQQTASLFNHLVGLYENARGNCETEGYSRLLVDD
jgi:hypothetical protein